MGQVEEISPNDVGILSSGINGSVLWDFLVTDNGYYLYCCRLGSDSSLLLQIEQERGNIQVWNI
jgi:hypothetical protein